MTVPRPAPALALLAAALLVCVGAAEASAATTSKPYTVNVSPGSASAGTRTSFTATFANPSGEQQQLGSANLTAPAAFGLVSATVPGPATASVSGSTVRLRGLALQPGSSVAVTVVADLPCTPSSSSWTVLAKQSNDFNGSPGNNLSLNAAGSSLTTSVTGSCSLRFVTQPTNARVNQAISGTAYTPAGPPVSVEAVDGGGTRVTSSGTPVTIALGAAAGLGTLSGTTTVNTSAGLATFPGLAIDAPGGYALAASSPGLTPATSVPFRIDMLAVACLEDTTCTGSVTTQTTSLDVTAFSDSTAPDAGFLTMSFGGGVAIDCAGYTEFSPDTALVALTAARTKTATLTIDKKQMNLFPNNGTSFLQLCFGSPEPFTTASGAPAIVQGSFDWDSDGTADPVYVGLLPDCGVAPCVSKRRKTGAGDGVIEAKLPAGLGDPAMRG
jgi:hypothetical protein